MKINDLLYETPEMTEDKLLEIIDKNKVFLKKFTIDRINSIYKYSIPLNKAILSEWDNINSKKKFIK